MQQLATTPLRDWNMLAAWLDEEWKGMSREDMPYHKGMMEAYSMIADLMRDTPPAEREGCLYYFLTRVFMATGSEEAAD